MAEVAKHLETSRADRSVWLMKCPTIVSRAWQEAAAAAASDAGGPSPNPNPVVAKVILSFDPLSTDEDPKQASFPLPSPLSGCVAWLERNVAEFWNNVDYTVGLFLLTWP
jgi:transcription initiation factor TFIIF subunit beta